jgi:hypothetical protein
MNIACFGYDTGTHFPSGVDYAYRVVYQPNTLLIRNEYDCAVASVDDAVAVSRDGVCSDQVWP